jgi:glyoxylase-like metal-dependent hydrolase (beta-lactamase superfamily II)
MPDLMKPSALGLAALGALGLLLSNAAPADEILPDPVQVSERTWAWIGPYGGPSKENRGFRMNLGFVVGDEAVAVIDTGYGDPMAKAMLAQIAEITERPVRYAINTNSQPHRVLGNAVMKAAGAEIIAGAAAAPRITGQGADMATAAEGVLGIDSGSIQPPGTPDRLIEEPVTLDLGGVSLEVIPVGTAHTEGSLIVHVPEDQVVFAGDVLYGGRLLAVLPASHTGGWIDAFERLRDFGDARFVPGHGEVGPLSAFEYPTLEYLTALKTHMDAAVEEGTGLQDAIESLDQSPWKHLADFEALSGRNAHQTYLEREAAAFE